MRCAQETISVISTALEAGWSIGISGLPAPLCWTTLMSRSWHKAQTGS